MFKKVVIFIIETTFYVYSSYYLLYALKFSLIHISDIF